ncbi:hypothetical protein [Sulfuritalea sp.]|uniref:hypothetical protein n=1 Tax=Sulfuritalea sp. TaxID=2480090 RepID=UPI00286DD526|nr:hypothetical protein [Sulfuritalea sp.]
MSASDAEGTAVHGFDTTRRGARALYVAAPRSGRKAGAGSVPEGGAPSDESCLADYRANYPVIRRVDMFDSRHIEHAIAGSLRIGLLPFRVAGQSPKEMPMSLKLVTLVAHDGRALIKVNPLRVNYLVSLEQALSAV